MEEQKIIKDDEIDLLELFAILWKSKKRIITIILLFTIVGVIYALLVTPWYEATVKIMPSSDSGNNLSQYSSIAAMVGINLSSSEDKQAFYPDIIKSNFVLDRVLEHKFITETFIQPVTLFEFWETDVDSSEKGWKHKLYEQSKKSLRETYINSSINRKTKLLTLKVIVPKDPVLAADLANFIVDQLDYFNKNLRKYKATDQRKFIEKSIDEAMNKLSSAQNRLMNFEEKNKGIMSPQTKLELDRLKTEVDVQKNVYIELKKQLELAKIEEIKETETLNILDSATIPVEKIKPKRRVIIIVFFLLSFFFSNFYIIINNVWKVKREEIKQKLK